MGENLLTNGIRLMGGPFERLGLRAIFWYGFALPLGPLLGLIQIVLLALTWSTLG